MSNDIFGDIFDRVWEECDKECFGHSDYWEKMKLRVKTKLEKELEIFV